MSSGLLRYARRLVGVSRAASTAAGTDGGRSTNTQYVAPSPSTSPSVHTVAGEPAREGRFARFFKQLQDNAPGLTFLAVLISGVATLAATATRTVVKLNEQLEHEREMRATQVQHERELRAAAVEIAAARTAEAVANSQQQFQRQLLELGYTEEFQKYRKEKLSVRQQGVAEQPRTKDQQP